MFTFVTLQSDVHSVNILRGTDHLGAGDEGGGCPLVTRLSLTGSQGTLGFSVSVSYNGHI